MILFLWMFACSNESNDTKQNSDFVPIQKKIETQLEKEKQGKSSVKSDIGALSDNAKQDILSPSPLETQKTVQKAGISTSLHEIVKVQKYNFEGNSREQAAIRVGVLLCDLIVSIDHASKDDIILRFSNIIEGMAVMKVGDGLMSMVKDMHTQYTNDAMTKKEIVLFFWWKSNG